MKKLIYVALIIVIAITAGCGGSSSTSPTGPTPLQVAQTKTTEGWALFTAVTPDYAGALVKFNEAITSYTTYFEAHLGKLFCNIQMEAYTDAETTFGYLWTNRSHSSMTSEVKTAFYFLGMAYKPNVTGGSAWLSTNRSTIYTDMKNTGNVWSFYRNSTTIIAQRVMYVMLAEMLTMQSGTTDTVTVNLTNGSETTSANQKSDDLERAVYCLKLIHGLTLPTHFDTLRNRLETILTGYGFTF